MNKKCNKNKYIKQNLLIANTKLKPLTNFAYFLQWKEEIIFIQIF